MARFEYQEKKFTISRREFIGIVGVIGAVLWTGAYAVTDIFQDRNRYIKLRSEGIYKDDTKAKVRQSHNNQAVNDVYKKFVGKPLSPAAEELLHTRYFDRTKLS